LTLMYGFVTDTSNPWMYCDFKCGYCYAPEYGQDAIPKIHALQVRRKFKETDCIMLCSLGDPYCRNAPEDINEILLEEIGNSPPETKFLIQTKNPNGFFDVTFPKNVILGCTIESNRNYPEISKAPSQEDRLSIMKCLYKECKITNAFLITIEPILEFDLLPFFNTLIEIHPWMVAIGYDNHHHCLPEPPLEKTLALIEALEAAGIKVYRKTLRKAWDEK